MLASSLVLVGLVGFVVLVYVVVVVGGGEAVGRTSSPLVSLSVLATALVALGFDPVQTRLEALASRVVAPEGQVSPYDALRQLAQTVSGSHAAEELPARIAHALTDGTGAAWSQVWLVVGHRPTLAASWPPGPPTPAGADTPADTLADAPGRRSLPVRHRGDQLGVLVVQERPNRPLTSLEQRLFADLAAQAGLVLRGARLRAELAARARELSRRADELRGSLQRLVDVQDDKRRLLERDIHDGAQQHLVALAVNLRLAETLAPQAPERSRRLLVAQHGASMAAIDALSQLSRGIYPPLLADAGLEAALRAATAAGPTSVEVVTRNVARYDRTIEAAAYFACLEALQNAAKHAGARAIRVVLEGSSHSLTCTVEDDGTGFDTATADTGRGLANMRDRVESVGGTLAVRAVPGAGTRVRFELPPVARDVEPSSPES
ncbi:hypothetical protein GCM10027601_41440 [Nocardioides ungokensis]